MKGLWTAIAIFAIQQVESQLVTPLVMARAVEVHPFVTIFAIVLFGGLFGIIGILLAPAHLDHSTGALGRSRRSIRTRTGSDPWWRNRWSPSPGYRYRDL